LSFAGFAADWLQIGAVVFGGISGIVATVVTFTLNALTLDSLVRVFGLWGIVTAIALFIELGILALLHMARRTKRKVGGTRKA
jgi:hypothetical protein